MERSSLRPLGKNPNDDIAKGTATSISTLNINLPGASARLRIGIDNVRRLWRIVRNTDQREGISDNLLNTSDRGRSLWTPMNCYSDDIVLRDKHTIRAEEKSYLERIIHPDNPFNGQEPKDITFSKETKSMAVNLVEIPRKKPCYVKRSNRTLVKNVKKEQKESERAHGEAIKVIRSVNLVTNVANPKSATKVSENLDCTIRTQTEKHVCTGEEQELIDQALERLRREPDKDLFEGDDDDLDSDDSS